MVDQVLADPGEVGAYLVAYLPAGANDVVCEDPGIVHAAPDGDTFGVGMILRIPEGQQRTATLTFTLPLRPDDTLRILPSARINPTRWRVGDVTAEDTQPLEIHLTPAGATLDTDPDD